MRPSLKRGISIVEIVVAAAIITVSVVGIVGAIQVYLKVVYQNTRETQAVLLLDETAEALQSLRDFSYSEHFGAVIYDNEYTVYWDGQRYKIGTSTISLPYEMTRTVSFNSIDRDSNDQIASSGTLDPRTIKAIININWPYKNEVQTLSSEMLIHDMYEN